MENAMNAMKKLSIHRATRTVDSSLGPFEVPEILEDLTSYVLLHVKSEGLFRIGGSNERVRVLQERLLKECRHGNRKRPVDSYWQHPIAK
ncbi:uncharacterized protein LOC111270384 isoform X4 [Varroa jacobsoni]|uniref:uncharacterized protein LOC111270384 isoform X4 n=1 Tax=Varroa jacobsoni TaxID=62625 RepID=UPI000BF51B8F|nr:uncharacterized protein LOC111270384 isoform X4 [Varroa jacobsoni]